MTKSEFRQSVPFEINHPQNGICEISIKDSPNSKGICYISKKNNTSSYGMFDTNWDDVHSKVVKALKSEGFINE